MGKLDTAGVRLCHTRRVLSIDTLGNGNHLVRLEMEMGVNLFHSGLKLSHFELKAWIVSAFVIFVLPLSKKIQFAFLMIEKNLLK